jgi:hypothetical protein
MDARTEIPEPGLLANRQRRAKPYLYSENKISNLLAAASTLKSNSGLRGEILKRHPLPAARIVHPFAAR